MNIGGSSLQKFLILCLIPLLLMVPGIAFSEDPDNKIEVIFDGKFFHTDQYSGNILILENESPNLQKFQMDFILYSSGCQSPTVVKDTVIIPPDYKPKKWNLLDVHGSGSVFRENYWVMVRITPEQGNSIILNDFDLIKDICNNNVNYLENFNLQQIEKESTESSNSRDQFYLGEVIPISGSCSSCMWNDITIVLLHLETNSIRHIDQLTVSKDFSYVYQLKTNENWPSGIYELRIQDGSNYLEKLQFELQIRPQSTSENILENTPSENTLYDVNREKNTGSEISEYFELLIILIIISGAIGGLIFFVMTQKKKRYEEEEKRRREEKLRNEEQRQREETRRWEDHLRREEEHRRDEEAHRRLEEELRREEQRHREEDRRREEERIRDEAKRDEKEKSPGEKKGKSKKNIFTGIYDKTDRGSKKKNFNSDSEINRILSSQDPYEILGLPVSANLNQVKKQWKELSIKYNASRNALNRTKIDQDTITSIQSKINQAYQEIRTEKK